jgi:hypothetical protein
VFSRCVLAALAAATLTGAAPLAAQTITSPYEFVERSQGLYGYGTYVLADRGVIGIGPGSGVAAGAGYSIRVSGPFKFDARLAVLPTSRRVFNRRDDLVEDPEAIQADPMVGLVEVGTADLTLLLADASLRFDITGPRTWNSLQPYALLGLGGAFRVAADNAAEEALDNVDLFVRFRNGFTGHFGGGTELFLGQRFTLRLDARNMFWRLHVPRGFITPDRLIEDREWVQALNLSIGASIRF